MKTEMIPGRAGLRPLVIAAAVGVMGFALGSRARPGTEEALPVATVVDAGDGPGCAAMLPSSHPPIDSLLGLPPGHPPVRAYPHLPEGHPPIPAGPSALKAPPLPAFTI